MDKVEDLPWFAHGGWLPREQRMIEEAQEEANRFTGDTLPDSFPTDGELIRAQFLTSLAQTWNW